MWSRYLSMSQMSTKRQPSWPRSAYTYIYSTDWHDVISDPEVELVIIATPNFTHAEIAIAAAEAGKHILCEKPMANTLAEGKAMVDAIEKAGVKSLVDFIYTKCPANVLAKELMDSGKLGDFVTFRGEFDCSYCAGPRTLRATWRQLAATAGTGALGDLTAHVVSLSDMTSARRSSKCLRLGIPHTNSARTRAIRPRSWILIRMTRSM